MNFCSNCGEKIADGAKFCSVCGNKVTNEAMNNFIQEEESTKKGKEELSFLYKKTKIFLQDYSKRSSLNDEAVICAFEILLQFSLIQIAMNDEDFDYSEMKLIEAVPWENSIDDLFSKYDEDFIWQEHIENDGGELSAAMAIIENEYLPPFVEHFQNDFDNGLSSSKTVRNLLSLANSFLIRMAKADGFYDENEVKSNCLIYELLKDLLSKTEEQERKNSEKNTTPQYQKDVVIMKCPHCGQRLQPYESICPSCKYQIRDKNTRGYVDKISYDMANIVDKEKDGCIEQYLSGISFPDTPGDLRALYIYAEKQLIEKPQYQYEETINEAWYEKIVEFNNYSDSASVFKNSPAFHEVQTAFKNFQDKYKSYKHYREELSKKEKNKKCIKAVAIIAAIMIFWGCIFAFVIHFKKGKVKMPDYTLDIGRTWIEVVDEYNSLGFKNILCVPVDEAETYQEDGEVFSIEFVTDKIKGQWISEETEISIFYFDRDSMVQIPDKDYIHMDYQKVISELKEYGFSQFQVMVSPELLDGFEGDECVKISYEKNNPSSKYVRPDIKVSITYFSSEGKSKYPSERIENKNYKDVEKLFVNNGFINIELVKVCAQGHHTDGNVVEVEIKGKTDNPAGKWFKSNEKVIIRYYDPDGLLKLPKEEIINRTYNQGYGAFVSCGFNNITNVRKGDFDVSLQDYSTFSRIISVKIDGKEYVPGSWVKKDSKISIEWTPNLARIPEKMSEKKYEEVLGLLKEAGFVNVTGTVSSLITGWIHKEGEIKTIKIEGMDSYTAGELIPVLTKIEIEYYSFSKGN